MSSIPEADDRSARRTSARGTTTEYPLAEATMRWWLRRDDHWRLLYFAVGKLHELFAAKVIAEDVRQYFQFAKRPAV